MVASQRLHHRLSTLAIAAATFAGVGLAAAPLAGAEPFIMPDRNTQFITDDGWTVNVNTTNEVITKMDNLAGASNSWQARVSLRSEARIMGQGDSVVQDAQLESGYFVGCRTDSSAGVELGADAALDPYQQVGGQLYGGLGGLAGPFFGTSLNGTAGVQEHVGGYIRVLLKPGGLTQVAMDRISLRSMHAVSNLRDQNIEADGCGGQVKIQSYTTIRIRTNNGNDTQTLYGEPKDL